MKYLKLLFFILIVSLILNSCFLAITGAPHNHFYKEINNKYDLQLQVHCMYLNKTFEVRNANPEDSIYIKSASFKNPQEKKSMNEYKSADSVRYYNWRILDGKYHKNLSKDTIEVIQIFKNGNQINYKFVGQPK